MSSKTRLKSFHLFCVSYDPVTLFSSRRNLELAAFREAQALETRRKAAEAAASVSSADSSYIRFTGEVCRPPFLFNRFALMTCSSRLLISSLFSHILIISLYCIYCHHQDVDHDSRLKAQQLQLQDWLSQQLSEQRERENKNRAEEQAFEAQQRAIQLQLCNLYLAKEADEAEERRRTAAAQLLQAEEARIRKEYEKERERRLAAAEVQAQMNSALLNELAQSRRDNASRPVPAQFKGFTTSQRAAILHEQERQMQEIQERKAAEKAEEAEWAAKMESDRKKLLMLHRQKDANRRSDLASLAETHRQQQFEHTQRERTMNKVVYANKVTEDFFEQFQQGCR